MAAVLSRRYYVSRKKPGKYSTTRVLHRILVEKVLGKKLPRGAEIHHVDGFRNNNINSNLVVCENREYHHLLHVRVEALECAGDPHARMCYRCHKWDIPGRGDFHVSPLRRSVSGFPYHRSCEMRYQRARKNKLKGR